MSAKEHHRILAGGALIGFLFLPAIFLLTACSTPSIDGRLTDAQLRHRIVILISEYEKHRALGIGWNDRAITIQLAKPLPEGRATEAGWTLVWPEASDQELSRVVIPWRMIGTRTNSYENDSRNYSGGTPAPNDVVAQIGRSKEVGAPWFAAIVNVRLSKTNPNWAIFTAVPYLPVTDIAYGWARNQNGHWHLSDFGTALIGCGITPSSVEKEFGFDCPPG